MNLSPAIDPSGPPRIDYRARRIARTEHRRVVKRRLALVLLACGGSAYAATGALSPAPATLEQAQVQPMGFETPGESFPGSAFYYLEDVPALAEATIAAPGTMPGTPAAASGQLFDNGAPARSMLVIGSGRDHVRAQECLTQAIYYEAASESDDGQRAVAQVVLNRVAHPAWPTTVCGVVYQGSNRSTGCQFTFTCDGSLARRPSAASWARAARIARSALAGIVYAPVGLATHYHTLAVHPYWADSLQPATTIGAHIFYRWPGAAGQAGAFNARYAGGEPAPGRNGALPVAPDPLRSLDLPVVAAGSNGAGVPVPVPLVAEAAAPAPPATDNLPASGTIRSEYANSGRWLPRP